MKKVIVILFFIGVPLILLLSTPLFFITERTDSTSTAFDETWLESPSFINTGAQHYAFRCSKCHGNYGKGLGDIPSLIDNKWQYGNGSIDDIYTIISKGTPSQSMKGWQHKLLPYDMYAIAYYIYELNAQHSK